MSHLRERKAMLREARGARCLPIVLVAAGLLLAAGCGGGGGGGGQIIPTPLCIELAPAASPGDVAVQTGSGSTCNTVAVDVVVTDVADVFAAEFTAVFDPTIARFSTHSVAGSFLGSDGATVTVEIDDSESDRVTVGLTRTQATTGVDVTGTRMLVRLLFDKGTGSGSAALSFQGQALFDSATPPQPIAGLSWTGGTLSVVR